MASRRRSKPLLAAQVVVQEGARDRGDRQVRPESRLKAAVIDRLYAGAHVDDDAVVISEMVVDNWSRRADVVLANGKLWGFEIKSEQDTLERLPGQIEVFTRSFEKLTVVTVARFEPQVRMMIPDGVGLWIEEQDGNLKERVRSRVAPLSREAAITLMTATELRHLLACNGMPGTSAIPRAELARLAAYLPISDLSAAARDAVKRRHRAKHHRFARHREMTGTAQALPKLARSAVSPREAMHETAAPPVLPYDVPAEHPALILAPAGPVLRRLKPQYST